MCRHSSLCTDLQNSYGLKDRDSIPGVDKMFSPYHQDKTGFGADTDSDTIGNTQIRG